MTGPGDATTPGDGRLEATDTPPRSGVGGISDAVEPGEPPATEDELDLTPAPTKRIEGQLRTLLEWVAVAVGALAVALLIKTFLLQAFYIPSGSMEETLHEDDRVIVNKLSYTFGDVGRGDVIVFEKPPQAAGDINDLIKRVIGLPGETVTFVDGDVYVDGNRLDEPYVEGTRSDPSGLIPGCVNEPAADRCTVPDETVFVMGDNRDGSTDSRRFGPIEQDTIVGRAFLKVWPLSDIGFL